MDTFDFTGEDKSLLTSALEAFAHTLEQVEAHLLDGTDGDVQGLRRRVEAVASKIGQLGVGWVPQTLAREIHERLLKAGYGSPGTPNTTWAMVGQVCADVEETKTLREHLRAYKNRVQEHQAEDERVAPVLVAFRRFRSGVLTKAEFMERLGSDECGKALGYRPTTKILLPEG